MDTLLRRCSKCGNEYPTTTEYFHRDKSTADGWTTWCKPCRKIWYRANRERAIAADKLWAKNNPEKTSAKRRRYNQSEKGKEYFRRWREANRKRLRGYEKAYFARNPGVRTAKTNDYRRRNPDIVRVHAHKRRVREQTGAGVTQADIAAQLARQRGLCRWCSAQLGSSYHVDHVIPLSRGGENTPANVVIACPSCNNHKHASLPFTEWTPPNPLQINEN
jgi:5-methylcytosine-specific restriction endonuclease McrA